MDKIIRAIQELLKATVANGLSELTDIKEVYFGDPIQIPESNLPALIVQPVSTIFNQRGSRMDEKIHTVDIILVYNQKSFYRDITGDPTMEKDKVYAIAESLDKVEKTDTDRQTAKLTVCGTIQANTDLPYTDGANTRKASDFANIASVAYTFNRTRGFPTYEVVVTVEAKAVGDRAQ